MTDSELRPKGTVELECPSCHWREWFDPLSDAVVQAAAGTYTCDDCTKNPVIGFSCSACNRPSEKHHCDMILERDHHALHCAACIEAKVPYHSFAVNVTCWGHDKNAPGPLNKCPNLATYEIVVNRHCDCDACWQTSYHVCDAHRDTYAEHFNAVEVRPIAKAGA